MPTLEVVIRRFESQLGVVEDPPGSNKVLYNTWYGTSGAWCATFLSWCFYHEGLPLTASTSKGFAYTPSGAQWFKDRGDWSTSPARGRVVFFDFPGDNVNRISHVGIVTGVNSDGSISTIEGNTDAAGGRTGGKVMRKNRAVGIVGYGVPRYSPEPTPTPSNGVSVFNPALVLQPVVSSAKDPVGGGSWLLGRDGSVYAFDGARFLGGCNGKPYFVGRTAAFFELTPDNRYIIVATSGERYGPAF